MKLDQTSLSYIHNVLKTADMVKIDNIIIEPGKVRAIDEDRTIVIFQDENVPDMPFGSIGINRIDVFTSRLDLARSYDNFTVDVEVKDEDTDNPWAKALVFKGKGIKVDYRCANPKTIQAPKTLNDADKCVVRMTPEAVQLIQKGQAAMKAEFVTFFGTEDGTYLEMSDINSDALTYRFGDAAEDVSSGETVEFIHKYPVKTIMPLIKACPDSEITITARGMLKIAANKLNIYVIPSV